MSRENLEETIIELDKQLREEQAKNIYLENECKELARTLTVFGKTCHAIYKCYPYVLNECCTDPGLIQLFKIQDAFQDFINKLMGLNKKENGENEI